MTEDTAVTESGRTGSFPEQAPERIAKYDVRGEVGRGGCGVVYKGFDPFVQRDVALKVALLPESAAQNAADHQRAFFAEARAAGMLQHPNIVSLYDAGVEGDLSYIVMEFIDGETLLPMCRPKTARMPLEQLVDIGVKCARALDYAHGKGVLHRDIKPSNIMLTRDGTPKLMDFSIAEILSSEGSGGPRSVIGSPLYMSPEQISRQPLGPPSDLYSLGAVLFQLLTGLPPFTNAEIPVLFKAIRTQPAPRVKDLRPDVPEPLSDVIERLLLKDPAQRFASGEELAMALSRAYDQLRSAGAQAGRRESRDSLRRLHFFNGFSDGEIDEILNACTMNTYMQGETLIKEGEFDNALFIIALGAADVLKGGKLITRLEKGDCVGEVGFLNAARRTATVVAASRVLALKVNASLMEQVSRECQLRFYKVFTETLIYRLSITSARLSALS